MEQESKKEIILAICYDFDKTLTPDDMQSQGYIQSLGDEVNQFWTESNKLSEEKHMDQNLAYMFMMSQKARGKFFVTKGKLMEEGAKVKLFPGVKDWFGRINEYGEKRGVTVKHYIISSGLKEMIEGTSIAGEFEQIYACSFLYDDKGVAVWPAQVVNYTGKTQFLFRIEKGALDINDPGVNAFVERENYAVPFRNLVYIGDSDTDIPCMKLVNDKGGYSIGVFNPDTKDKSKVLKMIHDNRIRYFAAADYSEGKDLDLLMKEIIDKTEVNEKLESRYSACVEELRNYEKEESEEERAKKDLINMLEDSGSFRNTHEIIGKLKKFGDWSEEQIQKLLRIGMNNTQVRFILSDRDVNEFYENLCRNNNSEAAMEMRKLLEEP